jgi:hypothetical protein
VTMMESSASRKPVLSKIKLVNHSCLLNGKKEWVIPLGSQWTSGELQSLVRGYCTEYEVNYVSEEHVRTIVNNAVLDIEKGKNNSKGRQGDEEELKSNAELVMELAMENIKLLFTDQHGFTHALITIADHSEVLPIENSRFKRYLAKLFWDKYQKVISGDAVTNATQILQAKAEYESETYPLALRVAWSLNSIYYDLTDEAWRSVKISSDGWEIEHETPILFTRHKAMPQVLPSREYDADILDKLLNLMNLKDPRHKLLVKVYMASLFVPDIPHVILNLYGDKGSAKSMLYTLIKLLIDPSKPTLLTLQKDRNEFIQQLAHNWIAYYDNAKHVPDWLSDEACRAATGGGHTKRKLYSDDEDIVYDYKRCLGFNGINISLTEEDALDRSILIDLVRIPNDKRRLEAEILSKFEELKPGLLGYFFDVLSKSLKLKPEIVLADLPRMADFALWGEAIARAMGYKPLEFIEAYYDNIGKQNVEAIESHPLGQAIAKWVLGWGINAETSQEQTFWQGSPRELLEILEPIATEQKIDTSHKNWPKAPNVISRRLNSIKSNLLEGLNIKVTIDRLTSGEKVGNSYIRVEKIAPVSPIPPAESQTTLGLTGDTGHNGDTFRTLEEVQN